MLYKGVKVNQISLIVDLEEYSEDWRENERFVLSELDKLEIDLGVENTIEGLVYIYLPDGKEYDVKYVLDTFYAIKVRFDNVKVNLLLDEFIDGIGNTVDIELEEYVKLCNKKRVKYLIGYRNIDYVDEILKYGKLDYKSKLLPVVIINSCYTKDELMNFIGKFVTDIEDMSLSIGSIDV